jgi:glycosyltransferase involved in cell wall biosynthesis
LKILEAMALHTPVLATPKGAEGLAVEGDIHLLLAESPDQFARQVLRLLREPELRQRVSAGAFELVQRNYDWCGVMPQFVEVVEAAMQGCGSS